MTPSRMYDLLVSLPEGTLGHLRTMVADGTPTSKIAIYLSNLGLTAAKEAVTLAQSLPVYFSAPSTFASVTRQLNVREELISLYRSQQNRIAIEAARESRQDAYSEHVTELQSEARATLESIAKIDIATGMLKVGAINAAANLQAASNAAANDRISAALSAASPESRRRVAEVARGMLSRVMSGTLEVVDRGES
jgi:hypothetical protein